MTDVNEALKNLVERLHGAAGENLESILLYGSAARGDFHEVHSDLNVLCTLRSLGVEDLARAAGTVKWWTSVQKQPAPLFFTAEELRRAADVFAIELLDMQQSHRVLYGSDVVSGISVPLNLHRIQVEHELRTLLLKLRQHFLLHADSRQELHAVLAKSASSARALLRHALIAFGEQPPATTGDLLARLAARTGTNTAGLEAVLSLRESKTPNDDVAALYGKYLAVLEKVIAALDQHLPKHQWQRANKSAS
jgi:predicted nucleotidyltransferase